VSGVNRETTAEWLHKFRPTLCDSDISNADETGIFFRLTPDKTLKLRGEKCAAEFLITVFVCPNFNGLEKRKLFVTGKSKVLGILCMDVKRLPV
jgi:hypothetical protein